MTKPLGLSIAALAVLSVLAWMLTKDDSLRIAGEPTKVIYSEGE